MHQLFSQSFLPVMAFLSGLLLSFMIFANGTLAKSVGPVFGSFFVHFVGSMVAIFLVLAVKLSSSKKSNQKLNQNKAIWPYFGGIFGASVVMVVGVTVNSELGVSGTISMMLLGQVIFGWITDAFGLFGLEKRRLTLFDFIQAVFILLGSGLIIYG